MHESDSRVRLPITLLFFALFSACGGESPPPTPATAPLPASPPPEATAVGTPAGDALTATIGPAGGSLSSPDGRVTLLLPAGALAAETVIGIQPITNLSHGGFGHGYRLTPADQALGKPGRITFTYADQDLDGTAAEALAVAFQTPEGYWELAEDCAVDADARRLSASTTHFSDWSSVQRWRINPDLAVVRVNRAKLFVAEWSFPVGGNMDPKTLRRRFLGFDWRTIDPAVAADCLSDWSVNGVPGGNATFGTIEGRIDRGGYTAPAKAPRPDRVEVSVKYKGPLRSITPARARAWVTIVDKPPETYEGSYKIEYELRTSTVTESFHIEGAVVLGGRAGGPGTWSYTNVGKGGSLTGRVSGYRKDDEGSTGKGADGPVGGLSMLGLSVSLTPSGSSLLFNFDAELQGRFHRKSDNTEYTGTIHLNAQGGAAKGETLSLPAPDEETFPDRIVGKASFAAESGGRFKTVTLTVDLIGKR